MLTTDGTERERQLREMQAALVEMRERHHEIAQRISAVGETLAALERQQRS